MYNLGMSDIEKQKASDQPLYTPEQQQNLKRRAIEVGRLALEGAEFDSSGRIELTPLQLKQYTTEYANAQGDRTDFEKTPDFVSVERERARLNNIRLVLGEQLPIDYMRVFSQDQEKKQRAKNAHASWSKEVAKVRGHEPNFEEQEELLGEAWNSLHHLEETLKIHPELRQNNFVTVKRTSGEYEADWRVADQSIKVATAMATVEKSDPDGHLIYKTVPIDTLLNWQVGAKTPSTTL